MTVVLSMNQLATREPVIGKLRSGRLFGFVKGYDVVDAEPEKDIGNCTKEGNSDILHALI